MRKATISLVLAICAAVPGTAHSEKYMMYDKDKNYVTIFLMSPCRWNVQNTGKEPAMNATVFSRSTNAPVARGCWRFSDDSLIILLKLEGGQSRTFTPFEIEHRERF